MRIFPSVAVLFMLLPGVSWSHAEDTSTCTRAQALDAKGETAAALLYFERCHRVLPKAEVRLRLAKLRKTIATMHAESGARAPISLALKPANATAQLHSGPASAYQEHVLLDQDELWLPPGHYELEVQSTGFEGARFAIDVESPDRMVVPITLQKTPEVSTTEIDMGDEPGSDLGQVASTADPRPRICFKGILPERYKRAPTPQPIPQSTQAPALGPWPYLVTATAVVAVGTGIGLQVSDHDNAALAGYGTGAVLSGLATYLFLRERTGEKQQRISFAISPRRAAIAWRFQ